MTKMRQLLLLAFFIPAAIGLKCYICGIGEDPNCSGSQDPELRTCENNENACFYTKQRTIRTSGVVTSRGCANDKDTQYACSSVNGKIICRSVCNTDGCNHGSTKRSNTLFYIFMTAL
ncbi:U-scoloptoxin(05)-Er2a-like [Styela clava]